MPAMALLRCSVLLVAGLLLLKSALSRELKAQRSPSSANEYGVKLCGREFIRAVIFTCGGSRWKRLSLNPEEQLQSPDYLRRDGLQESTIRDAKDQKIQTLFGSKLERLQEPEYSFQQHFLKEPFISYDEISDYSMPSPEDINEYIQQMEDPKGQSQNNAALGSDGLLWTAVSRRRREPSIGVAAICCKWGCTKAEISTLC